MRECRERPVLTFRIGWASRGRHERHADGCDASGLPTGMPAFVYVAIVCAGGPARRLRRDAFWTARSSNWASCSQA